jgi:hypothetical protein
MGFLQALASGIGGTASSELMQGVSSMTSGLGSAMSGLLGGGSGGGMLSGILGGGGGNNLTASSITLSGDQKQKSKQMYDYIKGKGYTSAQAKGIVANIYRESNFDPAAVGDSGTSHGLFQMHADRSAKMQGSVSNWSTNWKGQIDHALMDDVGPQYKGATSSMSAADAAYWWQTKFERPSDQAKGGPNDLKQRGFIKGMGYQNGGVANMKGNTSYSAQMASKSQQAFAEKIAEATRPIILPVPSGAVGGGGGQVEQGVGTPFPNLPTEDSSIVSMEYKYRITMGASV